MAILNINEINLDKLLDDIYKLSLFEIKQLHQITGNLREDSERNLAVKRQLKIGMDISYFSSEENKLVKAVIIEIRKKQVLVQNSIDKKYWNIYLCNINLDGKDTLMYNQRKPGKLDRNSLRIGDQVGYASKQGSDVFGVIQKLNPKNALVKLNNGEVWNVHYSYLFLVTDGVSVSQQGTLLIEGEIVN